MGRDHSWTERPSRCRTGAPTEPGGEDVMVSSPRKLSGCWGVLGAGGLPKLELEQEAQDLGYKALAWQAGK